MNSVEQKASRAPHSMSGTSQALMNLRVLAILMVISFHSTVAYLASQPSVPQPFDSPPYPWIVAPVLDHERWLPLDLYDAFQYLSLMPFMFFLSGVFVWPSLRRKGPRTFVHERLVRIGLPFLLGVYALMPLAYYPAYRVTAVDPSWSSYWHQLLALPFWPCGPLWFLWQLLVLDFAASALYRVAPQSGELLGRLASAGDSPGRYFLLLASFSAIAYLPLAILFGATQWKNYGPFALQPDRILLYVVFFFAGVGIGAHGYERGLLQVGGRLARTWWVWSGIAFTTYLLWMLCMAPSFYGYSNALIDIVAYLVAVLAIASACLCFAAMSLRFATARWAIANSLAENAYAMYVVHYLFVVWLQYALLGWALPAIVKAMLVFVGTLALSWTTAATLRLVASNLRSSLAKRTSRARRVASSPRLET